MKVFLDVGANTGQSLMAALDPAFRFDRIVCFEPASACWPKLEALAKGAQRRVSIEPFGLWDRNCEQAIHQPGKQGAGLWKKDKDQRPEETEVCRFVRASEWIGKHIRSGDQAFLKLNCEGAECDILDDLLDSGAFERIAFAMVDFDVRKIADLKHREAETRARLERFGFPRVAYCKDVMKGDTHQDRIKNWLRLVGA